MRGKDKGLIRKKQLLWIMEMNILDNGSMTNKTDLESWNINLVPFIPVIGLTVKKVDRESYNLKTEMSLMVNGKMTNKMGEVYKTNLMVVFIPEIM